MSLELFRKKCFQRRPCDTLCNRGAGHSEHPSSACCASSSTPGVPLHPAALPAWDVREKGSLGETLWLFQLSGTLCRCRQALRQIQRQQGCRTTPPRRGSSQHFVQLVCRHLQSVHRDKDFSCCICFRHRCQRARISLHGPRQELSCSWVHAHNAVLCASCSLRRPPVRPIRATNQLP